MLLTSFNFIKPQLKVRRISIDNLIAKFHYRFTFLILMVCMILVTSRQYFGEHIRCTVGSSIPEHVINTFCFFTTTFTVVRHFNESMLDSGVIPHPGIGPIYETDEIQYHAYYQWVPFVLFFQGIMFYIPHMLWRSWEGGKIKALTMGLQMMALSKYLKDKKDVSLNENKGTIRGRDTIDGRVIHIKLVFRNHLLVNKFWASRFVFAEMLNIINLMMQFYFTNCFLGGHFYQLGIDFINEDFQGRMDALEFIFPKVTKCHFHKFGPSGTIQKHDALCVMGLNVINEKVFTFLWFWYFFLLFVSVLGLIYRFITICLYDSMKFNNMLLSVTSPGRLNNQDLDTVLRNCKFTEWLFLYYVAKNIEPFIFREVLSTLANEYRGTRCIEEPPQNDDDSDTNETDNMLNDNVRNQKMMEASASNEVPASTLIVPELE